MMLKGVGSALPAVCFGMSIRANRADAAVKPGSAIVVGAGLSGSTAAVLLARRGLRVTLIEQSRFPRHKVCGECLSDLGMRVLEASGLLSVVRSLRPVPLERARFVAESGAEIALALPAPMWGVTRESLDVALLEAAREAGARLLQPARVERLWPGGACRRPTALVRDLASNELLLHQADLVLLADGKSTLLGQKPRATGELGIKAHFAGVNADPRTICLFGLRGHYVGLAPVSDGQRTIWNLAAAVPAQHVRAAGGRHQTLLDTMCRENRALEAVLNGAQRIGEWLACPLPRFAVRSRWPLGVIPLGNAAAALEPIGGEGMGLAVASAARAARFIVRGRTSRSELAELRREYVCLWQKRRMVWRALAMVLSQPRVARAAIGASNFAPSLATGAAALVRASTAPARGGVSRSAASVLW